MLTVVQLCLLLMLSQINPRGMAEKERAAQHHPKAMAQAGVSSLLNSVGGVTPLKMKMIMMIRKTGTEKYQEPRTKPFTTFQ